jgi:uncharacterized membrane protein YvbJ
MVYCTECGTNNADGAAVCVKCGAPFHAASAESSSFVGRVRYERGYGYRRRGRPMAGLIIGIIVIFIGLSFLLREYGIDVPWWEILLILLGVYLVVRWFGMRNRRR